MFCKLFCHHLFMYLTQDNNVLVFQGQDLITSEGAELLPFLKGAGQLESLLCLLLPKLKHQYCHYKNDEGMGSKSNVTKQSLDSL